MPRNGSSVYSLPAGNPVVPGTVIATTWANTTLTDIATALTNSLSTDGSTATVSLSGKTLNAGTFTNPVVSTVLNLTGGQLKFPAVGVGSADPNTLDDYEEGTWTPALSWAVPGTSVIAHSTQTGEYTKIGNFVMLAIIIATSTFTAGTASGNLQITGMPFPVAGATCTASGTIVGFNADAVGGAGTNQMSVQALAATSILNFVTVNNTSGAIGLIQVTGALSGTNKVIRINPVYRTNV